MNWKLRCRRSRWSVLSVLTEKYRAEMRLHRLREARLMTQVHLAKILGVNQAAVSKLERRADIPPASRKKRRKWAPRVGRTAESRDVAPSTFS